MTLLDLPVILDSKNYQAFVIKLHRKNHLGERRYVQGSGLAYNKASE